MDATLQPSEWRHENLEVLFSTQLVRNDILELPVTADSRFAGKP